MQMAHTGAESEVQGWSQRNGPRHSTPSTTPAFQRMSICAPNTLLDSYLITGL